MKKKILLVDDELDLTFVFKEGLEHAGLSVDAFNKSSEVLKVFKPHFYDLVILDIAMPDMNGFDLYRELKKLDPEVKTCFLTATEKYHKDFREAELRDLSQDLFIEKPISIKDLVIEVNNKIGPSE
jgi:DNA-binding response OmpR family regulator